jgi:hypothetical protein
MTTNAFSPQTGATAGKTVKVTANNTPTSVAGTVDSTGLEGAVLRIYNAGTVLVFVRSSSEAQASIAATAADIPLAAGASILIQNPQPAGKTGVAVLSSTTTSCDVYFTPGVGGAS